MQNRRNPFSMESGGKRVNDVFLPMNDDFFIANKIKKIRIQGMFGNPLIAVLFFLSL